MAGGCHLVKLGVGWGFAGRRWGRVYCRGMADPSYSRLLEIMESHGLDMTLLADESEAAVAAAYGQAAEDVNARITQLQDRLTDIGGTDPQAAAKVRWRLARETGLLEEIDGRVNQLTQKDREAATKSWFSSGALAQKHVTVENKMLVDHLNAVDGTGRVLSPVDFARLDTTALELGLGTAVTDAVSLGERSKLLLRREVQAGLAAGQNMRQVRGRVSDVLGESSRRAKMLVRWTTVKGYNLGRQASMEVIRTQVPQLRKQWLTQTDERTCPHCLAQHGQVVEVPASFDPNVTFAKSPPKPYEGFTLTPPLHPLCRCLIVSWHEDWRPFTSEESAPEGQRRSARRWAERRGFAKAVEVQQVGLPAVRSKEAVEGVLDWFWPPGKQYRYSEEVLSLLFSRNRVAALRGVAVQQGLLWVMADLGGFEGAASVVRGAFDVMNLMKAFKYVQSDIVAPRLVQAGRTVDRTFGGGLLDLAGRLDDRVAAIVNAWKNRDFGSVLSVLRAFDDDVRGLQLSGGWRQAAVDNRPAVYTPRRWLFEEEDISAALELLGRTRERLQEAGLWDRLPAVAAGAVDVAERLGKFLRTVRPLLDEIPETDWLPGLARTSAGQRWVRGWNGLWQGRAVKPVGAIPEAGTRLPVVRPARPEGWLEDQAKTMLVGVAESVPAGEAKTAAEAAEALALRVAAAERQEAGEQVADAVRAVVRQRLRDEADADVVEAVETVRQTVRQVSGEPAAADSPVVADRLRSMVAAALEDARGQRTPEPSMARVREVQAEIGAAAAVEDAREAALQDPVELRRMVRERLRTATSDAMASEAAADLADDFVRSPALEAADYLRPGELREWLLGRLEEGTLTAYEAGLWVNWLADGNPQAYQRLAYLAGRPQRRLVPSEPRFRPLETTDEIPVDVEIGGTARKTFWVNQDDGSLWFGRVRGIETDPTTSILEPQGEYAGNYFARLLGMDVPDGTMHTLVLEDADNVDIYAQQVLDRVEDLPTTSFMVDPLSTSRLTDAGFEEYSDEEMVQFMEWMVLDWISGNTDVHDAQFIRRQGGGIVHIDLEFAFNWKPDTDVIPAAIRPETDSLAGFIQDSWYEEIIGELVGRGLWDARNLEPLLTRIDNVNWENQIDVLDHLDYGVASEYINKFEGARREVYEFFGHVVEELPDYIHGGRAHTHQIRELRKLLEGPEAAVWPEWNDVTVGGDWQVGTSGDLVAREVGAALGFGVRPARVVDDEVRVAAIERRYTKTAEERAALEAQHGEPIVLYRGLWDPADVDSPLGGWWTDDAEYAATGYGSGGEVWRIEYVGPRQSLAGGQFEEYEQGWLEPDEAAAFEEYLRHGLTNIPRDAGVGVYHLPENLDKLIVSAKRIRSERRPEVRLAPQPSADQLSFGLLEDNTEVGLWLEGMIWKWLAGVDGADIRRTEAGVLLAETRAASKPFFSDEPVRHGFDLNRAEMTFDEFVAADPTFRRLREAYDDEVRVAAIERRYTKTVEERAALEAEYGEPIVLYRGVGEQADADKPLGFWWWPETIGGAEDYAGRWGRGKGFQAEGEVWRVEYAGPRSGKFFADVEDWEHGWTTDERDEAIVAMLRSGLTEAPLPEMEAMLMHETLDQFIVSAERIRGGPVSGLPGETAGGRDLRFDVLDGIVSRAAWLGEGTFRRRLRQTLEAAGVEDAAAIADVRAARLGSLADDVERVFGGWAAEAGGEWLPVWKMRGDWLPSKMLSSAKLRQVPDERWGPTMRRMIECN